MAKGTTSLRPRQCSINVVPTLCWRIRCHRRANAMSAAGLCRSGSIPGRKGRAHRPRRMRGLQVLRPFAEASSRRSKQNWSHFGWPRPMSGPQRRINTSARPGPMRRRCSTCNAPRALAYELRSWAGNGTPPGNWRMPNLLTQGPGGSQALRGSEALGNPNAEACVARAAGTINLVAADLAPHSLQAATYTCTSRTQKR